MTIAENGGRDCMGRYLEAARQGAARSSGISGLRERSPEYDSTFTR
jgi:hypothetical protein